MAAVVGRDAVWSAWGGDSVVLVAVLAGAGAYYRGVVRLWHHAGRGHGVRSWQVACFTTAIAVAVVALASPLEALAATLLSAHMVQHLLLVLVVAPLVAFAAPVLPLAWSLPDGWRAQTRRLRLSRRSRRALGGFGGGVAACLLHVSVLWTWHLPLLYEAAVSNRWMHGLEHLTMVGSAVVLWTAVLGRGPVRRAHPGAALALFGTATLTVGLAALITLAPRSLYPVYERGAATWGLEPLADQQIAGAVMWVSGGLFYATAGSALLAAWLVAARRRDASVGVTAGAVEHR